MFSFTSLRQVYHLHSNRIATKLNGPSTAIIHDSLDDGLTHTHNFTKLDCDMNNHVNHTQYFEPYENARIAFHGASTLGLALQEQYNDIGDLDFVVSSIEVKYRKELSNQPVWIRTSSVGYDNKMHYIHQDLFTENFENNPNARPWSSCVMNQAFVNSKTGKVVPPEQVFGIALELERDMNSNLTRNNLLEKPPELPEMILTWKEAHAAQSASNRKRYASPPKEKAAPTNSAAVVS